MIISASRRTDIPAFYSDWFFNRLKAGYVLVRNPMNYHQVSKVLLSKENISCIVFWTKNPNNILKYLDILLNNSIPFYFQFTLTPYSKEIEKNVFDKTNIFKIFIKLSELIGKERIIWRYDPIIFTDKIGLETHIKYFNFMANILYKYTNTCVISFIDIYKNTIKRMPQLKLIDEEDKYKLAEEISSTVLSLNLEAYTCSESIDLKEIGIKKGACIDANLIKKLCGNMNLNLKKDINQRKECGCVKSIDIGYYNTCLHNCIYCYANNNIKKVKNNVKTYSQKNELLIGEIDKKDVIRLRQ